MNVTLEDCIAFCGLDPAEVAAIAEHEHSPEIVAAALGQYLLQEPGGPARIRDMIAADLRAAVARRDTAHAAELVAALRHFLAAHQAELAAEPSAEGGPPTH
jgi:hypothetical protein